MIGKIVLYYSLRRDVATKHENPSELPNKKSDRENLRDQYLNGYMENGIVYDRGEEHERAFSLEPRGLSGYAMWIIDRGQYWGTRFYWIAGEQLDDQEEFERRVKLASFE